jgi:voltage-gated potassium channel
MASFESTPAPPSPVSIEQSEIAARFGRPEGAWRLRIYTIIFESDTDAGRLFDLLLILAILASVVVVILDSVQSITAEYDTLFNVLEWGFTLLFTVEYLLRLSCVRHPVRYATSFFGIVDLLAVLPTYLVFFTPQASSLINVRLLRLLRIFRILKLSAYISEFGYLGDALIASR